jgi:hypothetical protein
VHCHQACQWPAPAAPVTPQQSHAMQEGQAVSDTVSAQDQWVALSDSESRDLLPTTVLITGGTSRQLAGSIHVTVTVAVTVTISNGCHDYSNAAGFALCRAPCTVWSCVTDKSHWPGDWTASSQCWPSACMPHLIWCECTLSLEGCLPQLLTGDEPEPLHEERVEQTDKPDSKSSWRTLLQSIIVLRFNGGCSQPGR